MGKTEDPERLLSEALRAQAARNTPAPPPPPVAEEPVAEETEQVEAAEETAPTDDETAVVETVEPADTETDTDADTEPEPDKSEAEPDEPTAALAPDLGLSGVGYGLLSGSDLRYHLAPQDEPTIGRTTRLERRYRVGPVAILLLAVLLGLAAGAVTGVLTLL